MLAAARVKIVARQSCAGVNALLFHQSSQTQSWSEIVSAYIRVPYNTSASVLTSRILRATNPCVRFAACMCCRAVSTSLVDAQR